MTVQPAGADPAPLPAVDAVRALLDRLAAWQLEVEQGRRSRGPAPWIRMWEAGYLDTDAARHASRLADYARRGLLSAVQADREPARSGIARTRRRHPGRPCSPGAPCSPMMPARLPGIMRPWSWQSWAWRSSCPRTTSSTRQRRGKTTRSSSGVVVPLLHGRKQEGYERHERAER